MNPRAFRRRVFACAFIMAFAAASVAARTVSFAVPDDRIIGSAVVRVLLSPEGGEHGVGFTFSYNPALLEYTGAAPGSGTSGASLSINTTEMSSGRVGITITQAPNFIFGPGTREIVTLNFTARAATTTSTTLAFTTSPIFTQVFDTSMAPLAAQFVNLSITVAPPPPIPVITVQPTSTSVVVGSNATFSATSQANPSPTYQWQRQPAGTSGFANVTASSTYLNPASPQIFVTGTTLAMSGDQFRVVATNPNGSAVSNPVTLSVVQPPVFISPATATFAPGVANSFTVAATGSPAPTFSISGGTFPSWATLNATTGEISGTPPDATGAPFVFNVTAVNGPAQVATQTFTLNVGTPSRLANLSVLRNISGEGISSTFTIHGSGTKTVLIRGVGPTLVTFGVGGVLADPQLTLVNASTGAVVATNDDWVSSVEMSNATANIGAFSLTAASKDAAILTTLGPGSYTVRLQGVGSAAGSALFELYDAGGTTSKFSYLSLRGPVGFGDALTGGFVVAGSMPLNLLVRSLGPTLGGSPWLSDPSLAIFNGSALVASNDNWGGSAAVSSAVAAIGAVPFVSTASRDAAVTFTALPGIYTAQTSIATGTSGVALLEIADRSGSAPVAPVVLTPPVAQTAFVGAPVALSAAISGQLPMSFQWRKNGTAVSGATNSALNFNAVQLGDAGSYDVVATNAAGTTVSPPAVLTVLVPDPPAILTQPVGGLINVGNVVRFFVTATGTAPLSYQWRKDGVAIPGATNSQIVFVSTSTNDGGAYDVLVSNIAGNVLSASGTLSLGQLPTSVQPANRYARLGDPVTFATRPVTGTPAYQWLKDSNTIARPVMLFNLEGDAMGEIAAGQPIPVGRWTTRHGGAMWQAGIGVDEGGQIAGATNTATYAIGVVGAGDLGNYTVNVSDGSTTETRGPATLALRGNGTVGRRFFAVGASGILLSSLDATNWSTATTGTTAELRGVAVKGDVAVAVGATGVLLRSTNGIDWSSVRNSSTTNLNAVTAGPDRFVAAGDSGRVMVSADGIDWYLADSRTNTSINSITYGNGVYMFTGSNGAIFVSPDGFKWSNRNSQTTGSISFVTFAGTQFWALAANGQLLTSPSGFDWTRTNVVAPTWLRSLAFDGQSLVAVGSEGRIQTSANGVTWTPRTSGTLQPLLAVTWSGVEVPAGFAPATMLSDLEFRITTPPRAFSATQGEPALFSVVATGGGHAYQWKKDGVAISGATQSELRINAVQASDVADYTVTITAAVGTMTSPAARLSLAANGALGAQFLAVGEDGTVLASPDGFSFTERSTKPGLALRGVATSAFRAIAVGRDNVIAVSSDGSSWSYRTLTLPGASRILRGIAAGPTQFVAVGSAGTILVSFDQGDTWDLVASGTTQSLWSVAWDRTRFVAVGEGGVVLSSANGTIWTPATSPTSERLHAITASGTKLIAVSTFGNVFESSNGAATWQPAGSSLALWVRSAAMSPVGRRVAVGDRGIIATSGNGVSWAFANSPTSERLHGVVWTGGVATLPGAVAEAVNGPALRIVAQPVAALVAVGGTATFSVTASGVTPLSYQWQRDGFDLPGANSAMLQLTNVQTAHAGNYSVIVANATGTLLSAPAELTVTPTGPATPPSITSAPEGRTANVGGATNFTVVAAGTSPLTYRWFFNGQPIPGAAGSTLALTNLQLANAGSFTVTISNAYGSITSVPAVLTMTSVPGLPTITQQPAGQAVATGAAAVFSVSATGTATLTYQWKKDGNTIAGATTSTLRLDPVALANAGVYTVVVANSVGSVVSEPAGLTVVPPGTAATHAIASGAGYAAGQTVTITATLTFVGEAQSLGWEVLLPAGWSFVSGGGAQGDIRPAAGETQILSWAWTTPPASPVTFTYTLNAPASATGAVNLVAMAILRQGGVPIHLMARPDPLVLLPAGSLHSADTSGDSRLGLVELTRVIELYNTRNGTVRTGAYQVQAGTEDGFASDPARPSGTGATLTRYHSADTAGNGTIDLVELTRVIELYNHRSGSVRTGQYHVQTGTEDGFAPGP